MRLWKRISAGGIRSLIQTAGGFAVALTFALAMTPAHAEAASVNLDLFAPKSGDVAGVESRAFLVDLVARFEGDLASTGASPELTGPGSHQSVPPFPGTFGPGANRDHFPGLVVLLSSTLIGAGPGQNVANLFNIVAVTNRTEEETEIWATWIVGAKNAFGREGEETPSRLFVAVVEGVAPDVVEDLDGNGVVDEKDLRLMGIDVVSNIRKIDFIVNGN